jgi:hypothetical protein
MKYEAGNSKQDGMPLYISRMEAPLALSPTYSYLDLRKLVLPIGQRSAFVVAAGALEAQVQQTLSCKFYISGKMSLQTV